MSFGDQTICHICLPRCLLACGAFQKCKRLDADQSASKKTFMKADAKVVETCHQQRTATRVTDYIEGTKNTRPFVSHVIAEGVGLDP